ncbi:MAG: lysophospholipid acyltransferase family protein [Lachnospiraceae bacterium]|nr:lysophospholipid acyltransferase family protein [Lachnospiraceae bacterium]
MIRTIAVVLFLVIFFIIGIPILLVLWIIGKFNPRAKQMASLRLVQWAFHGVLFISGVRLTVIGEENVPKDAAVLYIGNHRGFFDIVTTYSRTPGLTGYIAKKEMEKVPFLSTWMRAVNCLFLDRDNIKEGLKTILAAIDHVKNGVSIAIFPEGTRNKDKSEDMLPFKDGSFKIAAKTGCPIIPMTINNSNAVLEDHFPKIRRAHVIIEYSAPVYYKDLSKEDQKNIGEYVRQIMIKSYQKNKELV